MNGCINEWKDERINGRLFDWLIDWLPDRTYDHLDLKIDCPTPAEGSETVQISITK